MKDYIEREAAYEMLSEYYHHSTEIQHEALHEALSCVPTADVRPVVRGEWIIPPENRNYAHMLDFYECPFCGYIEDCLVNFCPNCGADMRSEN